MTVDCPSDSSRLDLISAPSSSIMASSLHSSSSPPRAQSVPQDHPEDKISALPDHLLLDILEHLDLHTAIQASTLSRRWAHLPRVLSRLLIDVADFLPRDRSRREHWTVDQVMTTYTLAVRALLPSNDRTIKNLRLSFYLTDPYLHTVGHAVGNVVESAKTDCLEFTIYVDIRDPEYKQCVLLGQRFMCFFQECHAAFTWLTGLNLENLTFGHTDIHNLLDTCNKLELLCLKYCDALIHPVTGEDAILTIDAPRSSLLALEITSCGYARIDLLHAPKLRRLVCVNWICANPPLSFGNVPCLDSIALRRPALHWQSPFMLSHCLSNTSRISTLYLNFCDQMIWIEPEGPKHLSPIFNNLKDAYLCNVFYDCDLNWTLFILEAAPSLINFYLMVSHHLCKSLFDDIAEKFNVVWDQASPDLKHHRLRLLHLAGFAIDEKLMKYIRLVMERAVGLKRIHLLDQQTCGKCDAMYNGPSPSPARRWRFPQEDEEKKLIRRQIMDGFSSSVEISIG